MFHSFLNIEATTKNVEERVRQNFRFKTDRFVWEVRFNIPLDPATVNNVNLYVTKQNQMPLATSIQYKSLGNVIIIEPLEPYEVNQSYILNITTKVKSANGKRLKRPVQIKFKMSPNQNAKE